MNCARNEDQAENLTYHSSKIVASDESSLKSVDIFHF